MAICRCNYNYTSPRYFEKSDPRSITVPDQSLTIPEIFDRLRRGMSLENLDKGGYYDDPPHFDDDFDTADNGFEDYTDIHTEYEVPD